MRHTFEIAILLLIFILPAAAHAVATIDVANEQSTWFVTASTFDQNGVAQTATTANYEVINVTAANTMIVPSTSVVVTGPVLTIVLPPSVQSLLNSQDNSEMLHFIFRFTYGGGLQGTQDYYYRLRNLWGMP